MVAMPGETVNDSITTDLYKLYGQETVEERAESVFSEPVNVVIVILSILGLLANLLAIVATLHIPHQTTHSKLIISLSIADICTSLSVFFHVIGKVTEPLHRNEFCVEEANQGFLNYALLASLVNLLFMAIDHYIAIMKPLHNHLIMSSLHANIMVISIWIISILGGFLDIIIGSILATDKKGDFCLQVYTDGFDAQIFVLGLVLVEMIILTYLYFRIFLKIKSRRLHRLQGVQGTRQSSTNNMHNKKAIVTTILIVGTFMSCWIPNSIFQITMLIRLHGDPNGFLSLLEHYVLIHNVLWILMLSNSLCDPFIYALRLPAVQQGYRYMISKLFKHCMSANKKSEYRYTRRETMRSDISEGDSKFVLEDLQATSIERSYCKLELIPETDRDINDASKILSSNRTESDLSAIHQ